MKHHAATILALTVPALIIAAIWTWDWRWILTALITGATATILANWSAAKTGGAE